MVRETTRSTKRSNAQRNRWFLNEIQGKGPTLTACRTQQMTDPALMRIANRGARLPHRYSD
jgi:hypothetical protein